MVDWCSVVNTFRVKTFITEQKALLITQVLIVLGLLIQVGFFFALLIWGRPPSSETALVLQFFLTAAIWVMTINFSTILFWWVSLLGSWTLSRKHEEIPTDEQ